MRDAGPVDAGGLVCRPWQRLLDAAGVGVEPREVAWAAHEDG